MVFASYRESQDTFRSSNTFGPGTKAEGLSTERSWAYNIWWARISCARMNRNNERRCLTLRWLGLLKQISACAEKKNILASMIFTCFSNCDQPAHYTFVMFWKYFWVNCHTTAIPSIIVTHCRNFCLHVIIIFNCCCRSLTSPSPFTIAASASVTVTVTVTVLILPCVVQVLLVVSRCEYPPFF